MKKINDSERNIYPFFVITLLWTWGFGFSPVILGLQGTPLGTFLFYFSGGAPSVVGLFFVFLTYSKNKRRNYFHRCFNFKQMGIKCLFALLLFFSIIAIIGIFIGISFFHSPMPEVTFIKMLIKRPYMLPLIIFVSIISGPLNEEFGWRGFALDILLKKRGFWSASAILGFIWAIWHLPWYFMPGQAQYDLLQRSLRCLLIYTVHHTFQLRCKLRIYQNQSKCVSRCNYSYAEQPDYQSASCTLHG